MLKRSYVDITVSSQDKEIVHKYEEIYKEFPISLEITKPSEQSFKALLECTMQGASLLLFSEPIGRQEKDNLNFLRRSNLIPHISVNNLLWEYAGRDKPLVDESGREMLQKLVDGEASVCPMTQLLLARLSIGQCEKAYFPQ